MPQPPAELRRRARIQRMLTGELDDPQQQEALHPVELERDRLQRGERGKIPRKEELEFVYVRHARIITAMPMKVLRHVCRRCSNVQFFSVESLCRPESDTDAMRHAECPVCHERLSVVYTATELDIEEITPEPDVEKIRQAIARAIETSGRPPQ
jgi:hypothetical protein